MLNFIVALLFGSHLFAASLAIPPSSSVSEIDLRIEALSSRSHLTLILGASPCEESIRVARPALATLDSVCFINNYPQAGDTAHPRYFNIDFNNTDQLGNFATRLAGKFTEIYFDWSVLKFFNYTGLAALHTLLQTGGSLIIPEPGVGAYFGTTTGFIPYTEAEYDSKIRTYFRESTGSMGGPLALIGTRSFDDSRKIIDAIFLEELTKRISNHTFAPVLLNDTDVDAPMFNLITKRHPQLLGKSIKVLQAYASV